MEQDTLEHLDDNWNRRGRRVFDVDGCRGWKISLEEGRRTRPTTAPTALATHPHSPTIVVDHESFADNIATVSESPLPES